MERMPLTLSKLDSDLPKGFSKAKLSVGCKMSNQLQVGTGGATAVPWYNLLLVQKTNYTIAV